MYVIYPAEELLRIYEFPLRRSIPLNSGNTRSRSEPEAHFAEEQKLEENRKLKVDKRYESESRASKSSNKPIESRDKKAKGNKKSVNRKNCWIFRRITRSKDCASSTNNSSTTNNYNRINNNRDNNNPNCNEKSRDELNGESSYLIDARSSSRKKRTRNSTIMQNNRNPADEASIVSINSPLRDLTHANLNEPLKQHNGNALKLVQTGKSTIHMYTESFRNY